MPQPKRRPSPSRSKTPAPDEVENVHKVPKKQWGKWTPRGRRVFNELFGLMADQSLFKHPAAPLLNDDHWRTARWNAAWIAADLSK